MDNLAASPCSNPEMELDEVLAAYSGIGFRKFEAFTSWANSAFDFERDSSFYRKRLDERRMRVVSMHLPPVDDDMAESLDRAIRAAQFAEGVGAEVVLFKASSKPNYAPGARPFLNAIEDLKITPVLQNHAGSPISTLADFREVIDGIDDTRMKTLLEVGQFHSEGIHWQEGYDLLGDSIALVHIKDQVGTQSVPFGAGEIDLPGLFRHMRSVGYDGDYVVEMEVTDRENTVRYLAEAIEYIRTHCTEDSHA